MNIDTFGGRKAVVAVIILAVGLGVTLFMNDVPKEFGTLLQVVFGSFVIGNGVEYASEAVVEKAKANSSVPDAPGDISDLTARLDRIEAAQQEINKSVQVSQQALGFIVTKFQQ